MSLKRILGIVILAVGLGLLYFGIKASGSVTETAVEGVTGHYTDKVMWYLLGSIAMIVGGFFLFAGSSKK